MSYNVHRKLARPDQSGRPLVCGARRREVEAWPAIVVEGGPAEGKLKTGDILVRVNGKFVAHFWELERVCDGHVGEAMATLAPNNES